MPLIDLEGHIVKCNKLISEAAAHDLEAFNPGSELGLFEFKNFLIWM